MGVTGRTRLMFLAGDPVDHTQGYDDYARALAEAGIDAAYVPIHVPRGRLGVFLDGLAAARNVAGVIATIPHKHEARSLARPDDAARRAGAANLLRPARDGAGRDDARWECGMVDGAGFLAAIGAAGMAVAGRRVQVLGAGGAGRAVAMAIAGEEPAELVLHDPDAARAQALLADLVQEFPHVPARPGLVAADLLVNCSPAGMGHDETMPLPDALIRRGGDVYDVVNRADTPLLVAARRLDCRTDHGRSMMLAQIPLVLRWFFGAP